MKSAAYFVVAEGLANALKHSGAGRMSVGLDRFNGTLRIEISDNGIGGAVAIGGSRAARAAPTASTASVAGCSSTARPLRAPGSMAEVPCAP